MGKPERTSFEVFVDKAFWALILGLAAIMTAKATSIDVNLRELNTSMASMVANVSNQEKRINAIEADMREIKAGPSRHPSGR